MSKIFGGRYEVIERIGAGGMAIVYKAKDLLLNRIVTIKVLREQFLSDDDFIRRFRREAQSAASLSHANIVSIYDVGKDGDVEYIVMEYVEGRNLKEIIRSFAPLTPDQALNLTKQIAEAINHAHEHHIIHRDIKPHNILVTEDGRAKVTDFGIARAVTAATVTHAGDIVGSVHYLSPEQARGVQSNEQSDLYSLGIILYELLTGSVPYDGETPIAIALKHLQEQPEYPSKLNPKITPALEAMIMKAIAKNPQQRFSSAKAFLQELSRIQDGKAESMPVGHDDGMNDLEATQVHKPLYPDKLIQSDGEKKPAAGGKDLGATGSALAVETDKKKSRKRRKLLLGLAAAAVVIFVGLFGWFYHYISGNTIEVPNVEGKSVTEASALLQMNGLKVNTAYETNDTVDKNIVIAQDPPGGTRVKPNREIQLRVSDGAIMLIMPDVKNQNPPLSQDNAVINIVNQGFSEKNIHISLVPNATIPAGYVVDQNPAPKTPWKKSGEITLYISSGNQTQTIYMPNVVGQTSAAAQEELKKNNLLAIVDNQPSMTVARDTVISTNPKPGEPVQQGASVTIVVSSGPGPVAGLNSGKQSVSGAFFDIWQERSNRHAGNHSKRI